MSEFSGPKSRPSQDEYAAASRAVERDMETRVQTPKEYLNSLYTYASPESARLFARKASAIGKALEPVNEYTHEVLDASLRTQRAYLLGSFAGFALMKQVYGPSLYMSQVYDHLPRLTVDYQKGESTSNTAMIYEALSQIGRSGVRQLGKETMDRVRTWGEKSVFVPEYRETFEVATGVVVVAADEMQQKRIAAFKKDQIQELVDSEVEINWDEGLRALVED